MSIELDSDQPTIEVVAGPGVTLDVHSDSVVLDVVTSGAIALDISTTRQAAVDVTFEQIMLDVLAEGPTYIDIAETCQPGPPGPPGPAGGTYTHVQGSAAADWTIHHNLAFYPNVTIIDSAGTEIEGDPHYVDSNTLLLHFSAAFSGVAYLS